MRGEREPLLRGEHVHDYVELEQLRTRGDRLAVSTGVGGAGVAVAPQTSAAPDRRPSAGAKDVTEMRREGEDEVLAGSAA